MVKASPSNARGAGSILSRGAKIPHALKLKNQNLKKKKKKKNQKQYCNKFSKDFKNHPHKTKKICKKRKSCQAVWNCQAVWQRVLRESGQ